MFPSFFSFFDQRNAALANRSHAPLARFVWSVGFSFFVPLLPLSFTPVSAVRPSVSVFFGVPFLAPRVFGFLGLGRLRLLRPFFGTLVGRAFGSFSFFLFVFVCGVRGFCTQLEVKAHSSTPTPVFLPSREETQTMVREKLGPKLRPPQTLYLLGKGETQTMVRVSGEGKTQTMV